MLSIRRTVHETRIEIMPMIDVIFLLLTFFIYAMVLMVRAELLPVEMHGFSSGVPHEQWGEQVHAEICLREGIEASVEDIVDHCRALIAGFKCPKSIVFRTEPLPLSGAGKVLKRELRAPYWQGKRRSVS